jgi:hypothetical protein
VDSTKTHTVIRTAAIALSLVLAAYLLYINRAFFHDDAYITLRYARSLLEGKGIVWNPGEYVQGYTDFFHLVLVALLGRAGVDLVRAARVVGVSSLCAVVIFLYFYFRSRSRFAGEALSYLPAILVLTSAPVIVWSVGGLETALFAFLVAGGCLLVLAGAREESTDRRLLLASGALLGLATLTRPDGAIFPAVSLVWLALSRRDRLPVNLIYFAFPYAAILIPYLAWQWSYYGSLVPNTFYAKVGPLSGDTIAAGARYVWEYALRPPFLPFILLALAAWVSLARRWSRGLAYLGVSTAAYLAFIIYVGGDHMQAFRLLAGVIPLMGCMVYLALRRVLPQDGVWPHLGTVALVLALSAAQIWSPALNPRGEDPAARNGTLVGRYIAEAWPSGSLVALNTAGSTPYYAGEHRYIDMLGLNDPHIARRKIDRIELWWQKVPGHLKGDGLYVLSRKPDYIIPGPSQGTEIGNPWFLSDLEMARSREFKRNYEMHQVRLEFPDDDPRQGELVFTYYKRKSR